MFYNFKVWLMNYMVFVYRGKSRDLRKIIVSILKSGVAQNVKKINYVQDYSLKDKNNSEKEEEKILLISAESEIKLIEFLSKNFSQIKRIYVN